jgi:hypothetical protein
VPPRYLTLAIVAFWLATTGWMAYRDVWPRLRAGGPPPFTIELTDELSLAQGEERLGKKASRLAARAVAWKVELNGRKAGEALTTVLRHKDRTYELQARLLFNEEGRKKLGMGLVEISSITCAYDVTSEGDLRGLTTRAVLSAGTGARPDPAGFQVEVGVEGEVKGGQLWLRPVLYEADRRKGAPRDGYVKRPLALDLAPVPVPERGAVLNSLQPLNRLTGLHEGQSWTVPRIDPLEYALAVFRKAAPTSHRLLAEVSADTIVYDGKDTLCWRIDYREPRSHVSARTWARQSNGLVVRQEARVQGLVLALSRDPRR